MPFSRIVRLGVRTKPGPKPSSSTPIRAIAFDVSIVAGASGSLSDSRLGSVGSRAKNVRKTALPRGSLDLKAP
jgi:hypothetical protein